MSRARSVREGTAPWPACPVRPASYRPTSHSPPLILFALGACWPAREANGLSQQINNFRSPGDPMDKVIVVGRWGLDVVVPALTLLCGYAATAIGG